MAFPAGAESVNSPCSLVIAPVIKLLSVFSNCTVANGIGWAASFTTLPLKVLCAIAAAEQIRSVKSNSFFIVL